jgi:hypothetical protein
MSGKKPAKTRRRHKDSVHRKWAIKKIDPEYLNDWSEWLEFVQGLNLPDEEKTILSTNPILYDKQFQEEAGHLTREERIVLQKAESFHAKHGIWPTDPRSQENPFHPDYIAVRRIYPPHLKENEIAIAIKLDSNIEDIEYEMNRLVRLGRASREIELGSRKRFDKDAKTFTIYDLHEAGRTIDEIANVLYEDKKDQHRKAVDMQKRDEYEQDLISKGCTEEQAEDFADYRFGLIDDPEVELDVLTEMIMIEKNISEEAARKQAKRRLNSKHRESLKRLKESVHYHIERARRIITQSKSSEK